jgi:hypothetical protein
MSLWYLLPRLARHFLPERLTRFLLRRGWIIHPGLETREPEQAVQRYAETLASNGMNLAGKRILVFGYGGRFATGVELLRRGAVHLVLCDRFAPPDHLRNRALLPSAGKYLLEHNGKVLPRPEHITLLQEDIRTAAERRLFQAVDIVLSASVFEHLPDTDLDGIITALASLTAPAGLQLHFVDLRDHFFKYPFEMLTFSERTWKIWLNPTSNLNRIRLGGYQRSFGNAFRQVEIAILERDEVSFERTRSRIQPEFLSGDMQLDSVTKIQVIARGSNTNY